MSEASAEFSKSVSGDRCGPEGSHRLDQLQQEALIRIMASIRNADRPLGSPQLPGPGLQRKSTTSWEVFNAGRKKG
jgi:hypothetical protein